MTIDEEPYENITRVFWIKIELNERPSKSLQCLGEIKDVMSGARSLIHCPHDIIKFMTPYMKQMGIKVSWYCWLTAWRSSQKNNPGLKKQRDL